MPDGYFRAVYVGTVSGDQIHGTVVWNGDVNHPGVWQAAIVNTALRKLQDCPVTGGAADGPGRQGCLPSKADAVGIAVLQGGGRPRKSDRRGIGGICVVRGEGRSGEAAGRVPARTGQRLAQQRGRNDGSWKDVSRRCRHSGQSGTGKFWMDKGKAQQDEAAKAQAARQQQLNAAAGLLGLLGGALLQSWDPEADAAYKRCVDYATRPMRFLRTCIAMKKSMDGPYCSVGLNKQGVFDRPAESLWNRVRCVTHRVLSGGRKEEEAAWAASLSLWRSLSWSSGCAPVLLCAASRAAATAPRQRAPWRRNLGVSAASAGRGL